MESTAGLISIGRTTYGATRHPNPRPSPQFHPNSLFPFRLDQRRKSGVNPVELPAIPAPCLAKIPEAALIPAAGQLFCHIMT